MIRVEWRNAAGAIVDISQYLNLKDPSKISLTMSAEQGAVGTCTIPLEDPTGALDIGGLRLFRVVDDAASFREIWSGYTAERGVSRDVFRAGALARSWDVNLADVNSVLARHIASISVNRPAETDVARMQWLDSQGFLGDTTYLATSTPVNMDAANYAGQYVTDVINDCSQQSGKNWYLMVVKTGSVYAQGTWYGLASLTTFSSTARISNILSEVDGTTTFAASLDSKLVRDPSRVFSGVYMPYDGGAVYRTRPATATAFAIGGRDTVAPAINVKSATIANARADRYLIDISTEEDIITTSIVVNSVNVNDIRQGMRVQAKFSHLPDYAADFSWMRVLNRTVTLLSPADAAGSCVYEVALTLSPAVATPAGSCTTALAAATIYDAGTVNIGCHDWSAGPLSQVISLSPPASAIVAVIGAAECSFNPSPFNAVSAPYTIIGGGTSGLGTAGYRANATSGGTFGAGFTGGDVKYQCVVAAAIPTTAAAPAQTGAQIGTGGTVTLGAPPTPGNIIVVASYLLGSAVTPVGGWTTLVSDASMSDLDGTHGVAVLISARCVQTGDTAVIPVPNGARYHSSFVTEWAIT